MLKLKQVGGTLHITVTGPLRISIVYELTEALERYAQSCTEYWLNLQDVTEVSDGGLAVLVMFANRVRRHSQVIRLAGCSRVVRRRMAQLPLLEALFRPPSEGEAQQAESTSPLRNIRYKFFHRDSAGRLHGLFTHLTA